jgi:nitroreductase
MALAALLSRRTVRQYDATYEIPKDVLRKIVEAALASPTAANTQGLDLLVVTNKSVVSNTSKAIYATWPAEQKANFAARTDRFGVKDTVTCDATCLFFLVKNERHAPPFVQLDAGAMLQSIMVAAQEFGLDSMCIGAFLAGEPGKVEEILNIPKGTLAMVVAVGKAKPNAILPPKTILCRATFIE